MENDNNNTGPPVPANPSEGAAANQVAAASHPQFVNLVTGEDAPQSNGVVPKPIAAILPFPPMQNQQQQKLSRELKVEDALLYLDQVKMEFSDKPHIYNEFLDIMKNFKAQSINTPGVIERVKNLFRGYNKLILGFNTFLPEGEGYKIELTAEEQAFHHPGQDVSPTASASNIPKLPGLPPLPSLKGDDQINKSLLQQQLQHQQASLPGALTNFHRMQEMQMQQQMQMHQQQQAAAAAVAHQQQQQQQQHMPTVSAQPQQMQQAHAIHYVTKIRNRFSAEPETYRSFLKILHTYQKEQKGIKEVLEQVSQLFADHPDLLMEFTYFLPDAVQEQAKERLHRAARESETRVGGVNLGITGLSSHPQMAAAHVAAAAAAAAAAANSKGKKGSTPTVCRANSIESTFPC
eukprot:gene31604-41036_t